MSYQVIARKWRPQTFRDLVGQQHVTETLKNAILNNRVAHAYIFSGARGGRKKQWGRAEEHTLELQPLKQPLCGVQRRKQKDRTRTELPALEGLLPGTELS